MRVEYRGWDNWPDWGDAGRRVEIVRKDGSRVQGELFVDDWFDDGEGDEVSIFMVRDDSGVAHNFCDMEEWRILDAPSRPAK